MNNKYPFTESYKCGCKYTVIDDHSMICDNLCNQHLERLTRSLSVSPKELSTEYINNCWQDIHLAVLNEK